MKRILKIIIKKITIKEKVNKIPDLKQFMAPKIDLKKIDQEENLENKTFSLQTFGCAMNFSDSEIVKTILEKSKMKYTSDPLNSDIILINTCAIRDNAEKKIWSLLNNYKPLKFPKKKTNKNKKKTQENPKNPENSENPKKKNPSKTPKIGLLGCMAERLKSKIVEKSKLVDLIAGPDSYKDLPRLLNYLFSDINKNNKNYAINTQLSMDETYADIIPVRKNKVKALVSVMRGCANMCSFCIVPFVRGVERSRPVSSVLREVRELRGSGVREVTLLGQNVNSYNCLESSRFLEGFREEKMRGFLEGHGNQVFDQNLKITDYKNIKEEYPYKYLDNVEEEYEIAEGFGENYKLRKGKSLRFSGLLEILAKEAPEIRFRFTSPHPKDFPDRVLTIIQQNPNIPKSIHLPLQSGNSEILEKMNRKYKFENYSNLIKKIKKKIPKCGISTDIIIGFCGETEKMFSETLSIFKKFRFDGAFIYKYSEREKTLAHRKFTDDVPEEKKKKRVDLAVREFRRILEKKNFEEIGSFQLVLVEGRGRKEGQFSGKSDLYKTVVFEADCVVLGDFVEVEILESTSQTLIGRFVEKSSIRRFMEKSKGEPYYFKE